jgi:hypothetical protein
MATNSPADDTTESEARIAAYSATNPEHLASMVKGASVEILEMLVSNPNLPVESLDVIARKMSIRTDGILKLAENKKTPSTTLEWLYNKAVGAMRMNKFLDLISNKDVDSYREILLIASIGTNEATPLPILRKLASSKWPSVRFSVVSNATLPVGERVDVLRAMVEDEESKDAKVSSGMMLDALDHPDLPAGIRSKKLASLMPKQTGLHEDIAKMKNLDLETIKVLDNSDQSRVKENLYSNPDLPERAYKILSQTNDFHLLQVFAENPSAPEKMIKDLVKDTLYAFAEIERLKEYKNLALAISRNQGISLDTLVDLTEGSEGHVPDSILKALFQAIEDKTK